MLIIYIRRLSFGRWWSSSFEGLPWCQVQGNNTLWSLEHLYFSWSLCFQDIDPSVPLSAFNIRFSVDADWFSVFCQLNVNWLYNQVQRRVQQNNQVKYLIISCIWFSWIYPMSWATSEELIDLIGSSFSQLQVSLDPPSILGYKLPLYAFTSLGHILTWIIRSVNFSLSRRSWISGKLLKFLKESRLTNHMYLLLSNQQRLKRGHSQALSQITNELNSFMYFRQIPLATACFCISSDHQVTASFVSNWDKWSTSTLSHNLARIRCEEHESKRWE